MICGKCDHDLADCECRDLPERFESVSKVVVFGADYLQRILKNVERIKGLNELDRVGKE